MVSLKLRDLDGHVGSLDGNLLGPGMILLHGLSGLKGELFSRVTGPSYRTPLGFSESVFCLAMILGDFCWDNAVLGLKAFS